MSKTERLIKVALASARRAYCERLPILPVIVGFAGDDDVCVIPLLGAPIDTLLPKARQVLLSHHCDQYLVLSEISARIKEAGDDEACTIQRGQGLPPDDLVKMLLIHVESLYGRTTRLWRIGAGDQHLEPFRANEDSNEAWKYGPYDGLLAPSWVQ